MNFRQLLTTALSLSLAAHALAASDREDDVPVAPIHPVTFEGWTNAYRLQNPSLEVVVVPDTGRLAFLAYEGGSNLFRMDGAIKGQTAPVEAPDYWFNFGGDWFWPSAQSRWRAFQGQDWPPSRLLDGRPWQARAWKGADGSACCLLSQTYGEPLYVKVTRFVKLPKEGGALVIKQRIERTGESAVPVTLWNISQLVGAQQVAIPVEDDSAFEGGLSVLNFSAPGEDVLTRCGNVAVYRAGDAGEHKLGSDSPRAWLAAQVGHILVVEQAESLEKGGAYPDGGCTVEMYSNSGLGYTEIETLGTEEVLMPGGVLENNLHIRCFRVAPDLAPCELADKVRQLIGEKAAGPSVP